MNRFNSYKLKMLCRKYICGRDLSRFVRWFSSSHPFDFFSSRHRYSSEHCLYFSYQKINPFEFEFMKFTEKSLTQPGMAFSARAIIKRSQNGTLPAIYQNGSYELSEDSKGYEHQEEDDSFIDDFPQVEDVAVYKEQSRDFEAEFRSSVANFVRKSREKVSDVGTSNFQRDFDEGEVDVPASRTATPLSEAQRNASGVRREAVNVP